MFENNFPDLIEDMIFDDEDGYKQLLSITEYSESLSKNEISLLKEFYAIWGGIIFIRRNAENILISNHAPEHLYAKTIVLVNNKHITLHDLRENYKFSNRSFLWLAVHDLLCEYYNINIKLFQTDL